MSSPEDNITYCQNCVKNFNKDLYYLCLLAPTDKKERAMALFALHAELTKVYTRVSENMLGLIRYQWWHDEIDKCFQSQTNQVTHPILCQLLKYKKSLSKKVLFDLINSHKSFYQTRCFQNHSELKNYAQSIFTPLFFHSFYKDPQNTLFYRKAEQILNSWFLSYILMTVPYHAQMSIQFIPQDILDKHSITIEDFYNQNNKKIRRQIVKEMVLQSSCNHKSTKIWKILDKTSIAHFHVLKKYHYDPYHPAIISYFDKPWHIWRFFFRHFF